MSKSNLSLKKKAIEVLIKYHLYKILRIKLTSTLSKKLSLTSL
jgi:hypothetical protein